MIVEHVGLAVRDVDSMIDFYTGVFDFRLIRRTSTNAYLAHGADLLELMQAESGAQGAPEPNDERGWSREMGRRLGLNHIGFRVDDLEQAVQEILARGGRLVIPPFVFEPQLEYVAEVADDKLRRVSRPLHGSGWRIAVFADPEGTMLELLER